ncbi:MAG: hypothetical protein JWO77_3173 [Ilumatobacteraceae bacterium]|nr:hypothetical protein [Ilumatobacteraceae bacterium]
MLAGVEATEEPRPQAGPSLNTVVALILAVVGLGIGLEPLFDNSFFTHLATGRIILDGGIPRADPYSFSAPGAAWTVQSWGASTIYALIDQAVGLIGIRVLVAVCCVALTQLVWRLTSTAVTLSGRLLVAVPVVAVGWGYWVERPLLLSLVLMMAVLFALEDRLDPRWLIPAMWVWVNVHGSFPLALVAVGVYGAGRLLDRERPTLEIRIFAWTALGTLLGGLLNPLGWRLLVFPAQLLQRRDAFAHTLEWQSPTFSGLDERLFLIQLLIAVALVVSRNRRWRSILPVLVFGALSLQASRNIVHASLIMVPAVTAAAAGLGTIDGRTARRVLRPVQIALVVLFVLVGLVGLQRPDADLSGYPVDSAAWMREHDLLGPRDRVLTRDFVGNYFELRYGPDQVKVFFDDRVDMYPTRVIDQYEDVRSEDGDREGALEAIDPSAVLWDTDSPFGDWLEDPDNGWTIVHRDPGWVVAVPPGSAAAGG